MNYEETKLVDNESTQQFELTISGLRSFIDYKIKDGKAYLNHTEVPKELEGKGIAALLVSKTLEYLDRRGFKVVPGCSYIQHYLKRNPQWNRLLTDR